MPTNFAPYGAPFTGGSGIKSAWADALDNAVNNLEIGSAIVTTGGTANAQTLTHATALSTLLQFQSVTFQPSLPNTGDCTLNVDGFGAQHLSYGGATLPAGFLSTSSIYEAIWDGTYWQIISATSSSVNISKGFSATCATAAALPTCTYSNGSSGIGATLTGNSNGALTVDTSYSVLANDSVLVNNQVSGFQNGLYTVTQPGSVSTPFVLTRVSNMETGTEFSGALVSVENNGSTNGNTLWLCTAAQSITVGTTAVSFAWVNQPTAYTGGNSAISISGTAISAVVKTSGGILIDATLGLKYDPSIISPLAGSTSFTTAGTITAGTWNAAKIGLAYGGTNVDLSATGGSHQVLKQSTSGGNITVGQLAASDISGLATSATTDTTNASNITSGKLAMAEGGTNVDLSASGSATSFLAQNGSHVISARVIGTADLGTGSATSSTYLRGDQTWATVPNPTFNSLSPMTTLGDIIYENASPGGVRLAGNTTNTRNFLRQTGTGSVSAAPAWDTLVAGDIPDISATYSVIAGNSSLVTVGTIGTGIWQGTAIAAAYIGNLPASQITSGALALARGGTAADNTSITANYGFMGPSSGGAGSAGWRALVAADIPSLSGTYLPLAGGTLTGALNLSATYQTFTATGFGSLPAGSVNFQGLFGTVSNLFITNIATGNNYAWYVNETDIFGAGVGGFDISVALTADAGATVSGGLLTAQAGLSVTGTVASSLGTGLISAGPSIFSGTLANLSGTTIGRGNTEFGAGQNWGQSVQAAQTMLASGIIFPSGNTGTLTAGGTATTGTTPGLCVVDCSQRYVFSVDSGGHTIRQYTLTAAGVISANSTATVTVDASANPNPAGIAAHPSMPWIYTTISTNYVQSWGIGTTGSLTQIGSNLATGTGASNIVIDPSGRYLYVLNQTAKTVSSYIINQSTGALTANGSAVATPAYNPTGIAMDAAGRFLWVLCMDSSANSYIRPFAINLTNGSTAGQLTAGTDFNNSSHSVWMYGLGAHPNGYWLYAGDYTNAAVEWFTINQTTGSLTYGGGVATPQYMLDGIVFSPDGLYLYSAYSGTNNVQVCAINQSTGAPTNTAHYTLSGAYGVCLASLPSGLFLYVTQYTGTTIQAYTIATASITASNNSVKINPAGATTAPWAFSSTALTAPAASIPVTALASGSPGSGQLGWHGCQCSISASTQTINATTITVIAWTNDLQANSSLHSTSSNNSRLTADKTGIWRILATIDIADTGAGVTQGTTINLYKNGSYTGLSCVATDQNLGTNTLLVLNTPISLSSGDYLEIWVYCGVASAIQGSSNAGGYYPGTGTSTMVTFEYLGSAV